MNTATSDLILTIGIKIILIVCVLFVMMLDMSPTSGQFPKEAIRNWVARHKNGS